MARAVMHGVYTKAAKPILFQFSPDTVHAKTVTLGAWAQRQSAIRWLLRHTLAYDDPMLSQEVCGVHFANPVGLSAGFDKKVKLIPLMESLGFGFETCGSVTSKVCEGNPKPWFKRIPEHKSLAVHVGLANPGSEAIKRSLRHDKLIAHRHMPLIMSVARTNSRQASSDADGIQDYVASIVRLRPYPEMFEINISCPNTYGGEPFTDPARLDALLSAIDDIGLDQPVFIKMPSNVAWPQYDRLLGVIVKHNVQGVTVCNLHKDRTGLNIDDSVKGGLSGGPIQERSDELIRRTYKKYGDRLVIIGVGGIFSAEDAYRKITYGATMVALITGMIYEGPQLAGAINAGLKRLCRQDGFDNISQAIGSRVK
ncbi:MAG: quinone-dependent dihydroorotate dehydrogenase [Candidatus Saccharimonas sp.]